MKALVLRFLLLAVFAAVAGCRVPVAKQRLLARPAMQFNGPAAHGFQSRVTPQLETGAAVAGGAQASGCSSCR